MAAVGGRPNGKGMCGSAVVTLPCCHVHISIQYQLVCRYQLGDMSSKGSELPRRVPRPHPVRPSAALPSNPYLLYYNQAVADVR